MATTINQVLRAAREYRGRTQGSLSIQSKVSKTAIQAYERGAVSPGTDNVARLAKALRISITIDPSGSWSWKPVG